MSQHLPGRYRHPTRAAREGPRSASGSVCFDPQWRPFGTTIDKLKCVGHCLLRQSDLLQHLNYARVFPQFCQPRVHLEFCERHIVVLGGLL